MRKGKVYLAGGGCGDVSLVTRKTVEVLKDCDTVVYDSLVSEELLQWTSADCERIYVGKRYGSHTMKQSEINALLIEKAREGKTVVRLKGGDPYLFGRGGEEFMAVSGAGIWCEEIPGITSAIAVPAAAGIPVTHRGLSDSVTVVTGTAADKDGHAALKMDFNTLARLDGTLVILMGMHHLPEIVAGLLAAGKERDTPCAIIMEGMTERQRTLRAALFELPAQAAKQGFTSPAVIVIGAVAKLELMMEKADGDYRDDPEKLETDQSNANGAGTDNDLPRHGITVGVTGTRHFVEKLSLALRADGVSVWDIGFMEIRPAKELMPDFVDYDWLVFTSPNGVRVFLDKMKEERRDLRTLCDKKIAVVGPGTAAVLQEAGLYADYMPGVYDVAHLAQGLADRMQTEQMTEEAGRQEGKQKAGVAPCTALLLRAKRGSDALLRTFEERGVLYTEYTLYELEVQEQRRDRMIWKQPDYMVFGSAMGALAYFEGLRRNHLQNTKSRYVCIGEWCAKEVQKYSETAPLIAEEASVDALVACLRRELGKEDENVSFQKTEKG